MFASHDPFADLRKEGGSGGGEEEMLDFDNTYDGLGQQLDESGDAFNDDTFGGDEPVTRQSVGKDFDFAGQTASLRDTLQEEPAQHHARQALSNAPAAKPVRTGYEAYKQPDYIPKLEADASIWGKPAASKPAEQSAVGHDSSAARKMMSLEEVEAAMRAPSRPAPSSMQEFEEQSQGLRDMLGLASAQARPPQQILQRPQRPPQDVYVPEHLQDRDTRGPPAQERRRSPQPPRPQSQEFRGQPSRPFQQGPQGPQGQPPRAPLHPMSHNRGPSYSGPPITQAQQMMQMAPEDREAYLAEEAKRAKRNHKIFLLSKNNGLMTPQDKNFITRIQLQQLLTATGGVDHELGSEEQLAEDFYYQVYAQIRGPPRSGPGQPSNQFAQTYLFQTGSRYGYGRSRHHPRGGDNHVQRMEQQVARAVEAAKARPKNRSLVVEGSLGKIAFSNSKAPRPLLNIKRADSETRMRPPRHTTIADHKAALRDIERMYDTLMKLEDHERKLPPPPHEESPPESIEEHMRWRTQMEALNHSLWEATKVMEPISTDASTPHPFVQMLAHSKAKKAIPRVFRHLDDQQRLTMLTLISIHLDVLDVIRDAYPSSFSSAAITPSARTKDEIELFSSTIMPPLFSYVNDAPLNIIIGLLGLILDRVHVPSIARTKIGLGMLTMLISRAELVAQAHQTAPPPSSEEANDVRQWTELYGRLFDTVEPVLPFLFPQPTDAPNPSAATTAAGEDVHIWQFLAAMGVGASPDQQQRLVLGVKDKVMETVAVSKALPEDSRARRLGDVNLFMRAIGLDVELLG